MPELTVYRKNAVMPPMVCMYCGAPATSTKEWREVNRKPEKAAGGGGGTGLSSAPTGDDPISGVIAAIMLPLVLWELLKGLVSGIGAVIGFLALRRRPAFSTLILFGLPLALTGLLLAAYNFARFGDPLNNGYLLANQALLNPEHGSFSWHYITKNIYTYFLRLPEWRSSWPYLILTDNGLSLIATTPALLLLLVPRWSPRAPDARLLGRLALAASAATLMLYLMYFWDGWRQFGCRYTLDFTPFLIVALALRADPPEGKRAWALQALVILSIVINVWGTWYWRTQRI